MSTILRSLTVKVGVDLTQAQKGLKQAAKEFQTVGKQLTSAGKSLTKGVTLPIAAAGVASVKLASDLEETKNKIRVVFGESSDAVEKWAKTSVTSMGLARQTAMDMTATIGDMATSMGFNADESAKMGMELTKRAADMASFKNISIDIANTALTAVFTGETESLKKMGVVMTEANLQAYAMSKGMQKSYKDMTQAEKVQLRYTYVMEMTANAAGDFERTQGGVANQSRIVTESLKELGASMGEVLIPVAQTLLKSVNGLLKGFTGLSDKQKKIVVNFAAAAAAMGPVIFSIGKLNKGISKLIEKYAALKATKAAEGMGAALKSLIGPSGIIILVTIAIAALVAAFASIGAEARAQAAKIKEFTDSLKAETDEYQKNVEQIDRNTKLAQDLSDQIFDLADKERLSNKEKSQMVTLVGQLNQLMPDLNLQIDAQTGLLNLNRAAVDGQIESLFKKMKIQAQEERLLQLYKREYEINDKINDAMALHNKNLEELSRFSFGAWSTTARLRNLEASAKSLDLLGEAAQDNKKQITEFEKSLAGYGSTYAQVTANNVITEKGFTTVLTEEQKKRQSAIEEYYKTIEDKTGEYYDDMGNIHNKGIEQNKLTAKEVKRNLEKQIADFKKWREEIKLVAEKVPPDVYSALEALGPQYTTLINDLNKMTGEKLDDWVEVWRSKAALARGAALRELGNIPELVANVGKKQAVEQTFNTSNGGGVSSPYWSSGGSAPNGNYTLNVNGSTDPNQVAGIVVNRLKQAGVIA